MGSINSAGIWEYDGNDQVIPIHTYVNLLSASVTDVVGDLRTDVDAQGEYAEQNFTPPSPLTGTQVFWRLGGMAGVRWSAQLNGIASGTSIGNIPAGFRPRGGGYIPLAVNANAQAFIIVGSSTGEMTLFHYGTNTSNYVRGNCAWPRVV